MWNQIKRAFKRLFQRPKRKVYTVSMHDEPTSTYAKFVYSDEHPEGKIVEERMTWSGK